MLRTLTDYPESITEENDILKPAPPGMKCIDPCSRRLSAPLVPSFKKDTIKCQTVTHSGQPAHKVAQSTTLNHITQSPEIRLNGRSSTMKQSTMIEFLNTNKDFLKQFVQENISHRTLEHWISEKKILNASGKRSPTRKKREKKKKTESSPIDYKEETQEAKTPMRLNISLDQSTLIEYEKNTIKSKADFDEGNLPSVYKFIDAEDNSVIFEALKNCCLYCIYANEAHLFTVNDDTFKLYDSYGQKNAIGREFLVRDNTIPSTRSVIHMKSIILNQRPSEDYPGVKNYMSSHVTSVLIIPVFREGIKVTAVLELCRYSGHANFSTEDEHLGNAFAQWASSAMSYAEKYLENVKIQRKIEYFLKLTKTTYGKIDNPNNVLLEILSNLNGLITSQENLLFTVSKEANPELLLKVKQSSGSPGYNVISDDVCKRFPTTLGITGDVATSGMLAHIDDPENDSRFNAKIDDCSSIKIRSLLCIPITIKGGSVGVIQVVNPNNFVLNDDFKERFSLFGSYSGLAFHVSRSYEKCNRSEAQCRTTLDCMSLHTSYDENEFQLLTHQNVPTDIPGIYDFDFSPWSIGLDRKALVVIYMFQTLFGSQIEPGEYQLKPTEMTLQRGYSFKFDPETLRRFILTVKKNYRAIIYHNFEHAFSVVHSMFTIISNCKNKFLIEEKLAMFIGCLCHDIDHRGKSNQFMLKSESPLAHLYSSSTMERHHFNLTVAILQRDGHNIFNYVSSFRYKYILRLIRHCILATDLQEFLNFKKEFADKIERGFRINWGNEGNRRQVMSLSMTTCDLCAMFKSWKIQFSVVLKIVQEFWLEGDEEKKANRIPIPLMDRDYRADLPFHQVGFIKIICIPCFDTLTKVFPEFSIAASRTKSNLSKWEELGQLEKEERLQELSKLENEVIEESKTLLTTKVFSITTTFKSNDGDPPSESCDSLT